LVDKSDLGFGKRSWRYSALVKNKKIVKAFVEPNEAGDPFKVSDADTMLKYINPNVELPPDVTLFTKPGCSFCTQAKQLLESRGLSYEEIVVGKDTNIRAMRSVSGGSTTPQVFINGKSIGGFQELQASLSA
jgi:glutaredoxin-like protein